MNVTFDGNDKNNMGSFFFLNETTACEIKSLKTFKVQVLTN